MKNVTRANSQFSIILSDTKVRTLVLLTFPPFLITKRIDIIPLQMCSMLLFVCFIIYNQSYGKKKKDKLSLSLQSRSNQCLGLSHKKERLKSKENLVMIQLSLNSGIEFF